LCVSLFIYQERNFFEVQKIQNTFLVSWGNLES